MVIKMSDNNSSIIHASSIKEQEDYKQSANTLFHFMKEKQFLEAVLKRKALVPRYCLEDINYLNIEVSGHKFKEVAILQKCFCDIPLHKITTDFDCTVVKAVSSNQESTESRNSIRVSHILLYGSFGIAFSKEWCEAQSLQPVHYLNERSAYTNDFKLLLSKIISDNDLPEEFSSDILQRLALIKPIRGIMKRREDSRDYYLYKNFHDEQEWRYIPNLSRIEQVNASCSNKYELIIANPNLLELQSESGLRFIDKQSHELENERYKGIWLNFEYNDVRYLIVPDRQSRVDIINFIMKLPESNFTDLDMRYILISKILVLDEVRKDW